MRVAPILVVGIQEAVHGTHYAKGRQQYATILLHRMLTKLLLKGTLFIKEHNTRSKKLRFFFQANTRLMFTKVIVPLLATDCIFIFFM